MSELIRISTVNHDKASDKYCGLEVKYITYIVISFVVSAFILIASVFGENLKEVSVIRIGIVSCMPLLTTVAYIVYFFFKRSPHFHEDFWSSHLSGKNYWEGPRKHLKENPYK